MYSVVGTATAGLTGSLAVVLPRLLNTQTAAPTSASTATTATAEPISTAGREPLFGVARGKGVE